jgi:hypothetical protein
MFPFDQLIVLFRHFDAAQCGDFIRCPEMSAFGRTLLNQDSVDIASDEIEMLPIGSTVFFRGKKPVDFMRYINLK